MGLEQMLEFARLKHSRIKTFMQLIIGILVGWTTVSLIYFDSIFLKPFSILISDFLILNINRFSIVFITVISIVYIFIIFNYLMIKTENQLLSKKKQSKKKIKKSKEKEEKQLIKESKK